MVDWHDPLVVLQDSETLGHLYRIAAGIYLWEWITTLYFDWRLIYSGRSEWRWPTTVYLLCRLMGLAAAFCTFIQLESTNEHNCNTLTHALVGFGYASMGLSSALIALRIIGIWGPSLQVILSVSTVFLVNVGFILYGIIRNGGSEWSNTEKICVDIDTTRNNINIFVAFATDTIMLFMMLFGIWWNRAGAGSLWQLIKRQGVIWLTVSVLFYIPVVVIASLNLNDAMNLLFQLPLCMAMTICSTRMYRSLYEYTNPSQFTIHASEPLHFAAGANTCQSEPGANGGTFGDVTLMVQTEKTARNDVKTTASVYAQV